MPKKQDTQENPSKLWYLLPIILGAVGSLIGYLKFYKTNRGFANILAIVGIVCTVLPISLTIIGFFLGFFGTLFGVIPPLTVGAKTTTTPFDTTNIYGKQIRIENIIKLGNDYKATIIATERKSVDFSDLGIYNSIGNQVTVIPGSEWPIDPGEIGTFTFPQSECATGTKIRVVAPGNSDSSICP